MPDLLDRITNLFTPSAMTLIEDLTGSPPEALSLDIDRRAQTESEREALQDAIATRDERRELVELAKRLEKTTRQQIENARSAERIGASESDEALDEATAEHAQVKAALEKRREELIQAEKRVRVAREKLSKAQDEAKATLQKTMKAHRDAAMQRVTAALNEAQAATFELYVLRMLQRTAGVSMRVPISEDLLPAAVVGGPSVLQRMRSLLGPSRTYSRPGFDHDLQTGDEYGAGDTAQLNRVLQQWAQPAKVEPIEEDDAPAGDGATGRAEIPAAA